MSVISLDWFDCVDTQADLSLHRLHVSYGLFIFYYVKLKSAKCSFIINAYLPKFNHCMCIGRQQYNIQC